MENLSVYPAIIFHPLPGFLLRGSTLLVELKPVTGVSLICDNKITLVVVAVELLFVRICQNYFDRTLMVNQLLFVRIIQICWKEDDVK